VWLAYKSRDHLSSERELIHDAHTACRAIFLDGAEAGRAASLSDAEVVLRCYSILLEAGAEVSATEDVWLVASHLAAGTQPVPASPVA